MVQLACLGSTQICAAVTDTARPQPRRLQFDVLPFLNTQRHGTPQMKLTLLQFSLISAARYADAGHCAHSELFHLESTYSSRQEMWHFLFLLSIGQ